MLVKHRPFKPQPSNCASQSKPVMSRKHGHKVADDKHPVHVGASTSSNFAQRAPASPASAESGALESPIAWGGGLASPVESGGLASLEQPEIANMKARESTLAVRWRHSD
jgi:hypothetical protein